MNEIPVNLSLEELFYLINVIDYLREDTEVNEDLHCKFTIAYDQLENMKGFEK